MNGSPFGTQKERLDRDIEAIQEKLEERLNSNEGKSGIGADVLETRMNFRGLQK